MRICFFLFFRGGDWNGSKDEVDLYWCFGGDFDTFFVLKFIKVIGINFVILFEELIKKAIFLLGDVILRVLIDYY